MENEEKKKGGRPAYKVTDAGKKQVLRLSGLGLSQEEVSASMGISVDTLVKYFSVEYEKGKSDSLVELVNVLREKAIKDKDFKSINLLVKCKYGWKETEVKEHTG